jgi:DNA-directed RNA polymerase subunit RPC12/RpoP
MSDSVRDLLVRGVAAAKAKDKREARFYLEWALRLDASIDQRVEAWYWLSEVSDEPAEKRRYLEEVLGYQPNHYQARRRLAVLDGRLKPQEIVDPDQLPPAWQPEAETVEAQRFVCPQCGGRLTYTPDGSALTCEYCDQRLATHDLSQSTAAEARDFTLTLATAIGHTRPVAMQAFTCQACGAAFVLSPQAISITCPYCDSVYVVATTETHELIPPEAIIPFSTHLDQAERAFSTWLVEQRLPPAARRGALHGVYLPAWAYTISGHLPWKGLEYRDRQWLPTSGYQLILCDNLLIPASRALPEQLVDEYVRFNLDGLRPYQAAYLANWPAETYQISVSDASLEARQAALKKARAAIASNLTQPTREITIDSSPLLIESFKLLLLPLWVAHYHFENRRYLGLVNGQSGQARGELPAQGLRQWLSRLVA